MRLKYESLRSHPDGFQALAMLRDWFRRKVRRRGTAGRVDAALRDGCSHGAAPHQAAPRTPLTVTQNAILPACPPPQSQGWHTAKFLVGNAIAVKRVGNAEGRHQDVMEGAAVHIRVRAAGLNKAQE